MTTIKCAVNALILSTVLFSLNFGTNTALSTLFVEELCYGNSSPKINLRYQNSFILASVATEALDCEIRVETQASYSIVVSFYRYHLKGDDSLIFIDRHNFQLALTGEGIFLDERKSLSFEGPLTIKYFTNNTQVGNKLKFQIVLTQVHDGPCSPQEYKCQNNKCIQKNLACDQHNHCGDNNHQNICNPNKDTVVQAKYEVVEKKSSVWIISIGICAGILGIVIIVFIVVLARGCAQRNKKPKPQQLPTVAASFATQRPSPPTVLNRIRQSFRSVRQPTAPPPPSDTAAPHSPESYEVPSMYPNLQSVRDAAGVDNPQFKADE